MTGKTTIGATAAMAPFRCYALFSPLLSAFSPLLFRNSKMAFITLI
ncbi:MAG: hypothetical protein ABIS51_07160 [Sphingomonas sp.]